MIHCNAPFLKEYQIEPKKNRGFDLISVIIKIASCIPGIAIICGIGYIAESSKLRSMHPSLEATADQMLLRGIVCILGFGILNMLYDRFRERSQNEYIDLILKHGYENAKTIHTFQNNIQKIFNIDFPLIKNFEDCQDVAIQFKYDDEIFETNPCNLNKLSCILEHLKPDLLDLGLLFSKLSFVSDELLDHLKVDRIRLTLIQMIQRYKSCEFDINVAIKALLKSDAITMDLLCKAIDPLLATPGKKNITKLFEISAIPEALSAAAPLLVKLNDFSQKLDLLEWVAKKPQDVPLVMTLIKDLTSPDLIELIVDSIKLIPHFSELDHVSLNRYFLTLQDPDAEKVLLAFLNESDLEKLLSYKHYKFTESLLNGALKTLFRLDDFSPIIKKAYLHFWQNFIGTLPQSEILYKVKNLYFMVLDSKTRRPKLDAGRINMINDHLHRILHLYSQKSDNRDLILKICTLLKDSAKKYSDPYLPKILENKIILGGSATHAVIYVIDEEDDETFTFTIYNSGEGSFIIEGKQVPLKYQRLSKLELNDEFFTQLNTFNNLDVPFMTILDYIKSKLAVSSVYATQHKLQNHDSCAYKCFSCYLHAAMGDIEYRRFKVFLTEILIEEFIALPKGPHLPISDEEYDDMLREAEEVLIKRMAKSL